MSIQTNILPNNPQIEVIKSGKTGLFTNYIYKAIPLAFDESMSYYETLCGLLHYLKFTIIPTVNNNADAVAELQNLYEELRTYVDDYFKGLDVQQEINNKLDAMVEAGTLQEIIANYLNSKAIFGYDNVEAMKNATNLINGSYAKTLGYNQINDKGKAIYKIRTKTESDIINNTTIIQLNNENLVAVLINNGINNVKVFNDDIKSAIENSSVLYLNNETYNIDINETIIKNNIKIIGNNSIIQTTSNVNYLFNFTNSYLENIKFIETNIDNYNKNIIFTGNNLSFKKCEFESTIAYKGLIENIEFINCIFNNYYREIEHNNGSLKNLKIIDSEFKREQTYSEPYVGDTRILIYNYNGVNNPITETMLNSYGNNIIIKNNKFASCNKRQIHIFNCLNVIIENNKFNASGLDSSVLGGSDDLVSLDFVQYFSVNENYFGNSGENELDILSSKNGEIKNNVIEKSYDYFAIDINWSDYVRTFGENLNDKNLLKSKDVIISNNTIKSHTYTFNITPSENIHIINNNIVNNVSTNIILFDDFGTLTPETKSNLTIKNLDVGENNVKTSLGDFGKITVRTNYDYIIDNDSGHLSKDICCYTQQTVDANTIVFCTNGFPCKNGEAGKLIALDNSFRSVTPSIVRWLNNESVRKGIDFIGNRYNDKFWNTLFYTGNYLDKYPLAQTFETNGSYDGTETTGTIAFKSW